MFNWNKCNTYFLKIPLHCFEYTKTSISQNALSIFWLGYLFLSFVKLSMILFFFSSNRALMFNTIVYIYVTSIYGIQNTFLSIVMIRRFIMDLINAVTSFQCVGWCVGGGVQSRGVRCADPAGCATPRAPHSTQNCTPRKPCDAHWFTSKVILSISLVSTGVFQLTFHIFINSTPPLTCVNII